jgi:hypothetical protein
LKHGHRNKGGTDMLLEQQHVEPPATEAATEPTPPATTAASGSAAPPAADGSAGSSAIEAAGPPQPPLEVGGIDERGNTVKYIYAIDPDYTVYYSRLERPDGGWQQRLHLERAHRKSAERLSYEREGVQARLSSDPKKRQEQRRKLLTLGNNRAKLLALLSGWPRRESYDSSIATALQLALDGDGDGASLQTALDTLDDARKSILSERELAGRTQYVLWALISGVIGFFVLVAAQHNLLHGSGDFWLGTQAGLLGAIFSIAIGIRKRTVAPNNNRWGNLSDGVLRLVIGAVSGGTLVLLFATGVVPALQTHAGTMDGVASVQFVVLVGIIAGFVEQLVPGILEAQGGKFGDSSTPAAGKAGDNATPAAGKKA